MNKKACIQVITDIDTGTLKLDWSMVYAQSTDVNKTRSKVYRRVTGATALTRLPRHTYR